MIHFEQALRDFAEGVEGEGPYLEADGYGVDGAARAELKGGVEGPEIWIGAASGVV